MGVIVPKERERGAEKDTIKTNQRDGKKADTAMILTPLMEQGMAERESPLIVTKTLTNRVKLTTTGPIRIIIAKAEGLTTHSLERKTYIALAATEQTSITVQYPSSHVKNILVKGMHFHLGQLIPTLRTHPGKMKKTN
uniref:USP42-like protein n=1 Tax=Nipponia nippon TaxID=128390 RepID=A0A0B5JAY2_NIPNI|nr:USP42-like protein [Nipponia nippon]